MAYFWIKKVYDLTKDYSNPDQQKSNKEYTENKLRKDQVLDERGILMKNLFLLVTLISIAACNSVLRCENLVECYIFPTGVSSNTYFIEISDIGIIRTTFGEKDIERIESTETLNSKSAILKPEDFKEIERIANRIKKIDPIKNNIIKKGGWEIILSIGDKKYHYYYGDKVDVSIKDMVSLIKKVSPIRIDIHSWS